MLTLNFLTGFFNVGFPSTVSLSSLTFSIPRQSDGSILHAWLNQEYIYDQNIFKYKSDVTLDYLTLIHTPPCIEDSL